MDFRNIAEIETADFSEYQSCRGPADRKTFEKLISTIVDETASEDERSDAIYDGIWDLFCHQYTIYSATPLALYLVLTMTTKEQRQKYYDLESFIQHCRQRGSKGILLTEAEEEAINRGDFFVFSIEDVLSVYA